MGVEPVARPRTVGLLLEELSRMSAAISAATARLASVLEEKMETGMRSGVGVMEDSSPQRHREQKEEKTGGSVMGKANSWRVRRLGWLRAGVSRGRRGRR